ncbi:MAG TPA: UDP-N-acetylglucosamine 2-epimerase (non-hydrolyzing) [Ignavibacteriaceae bacterium]|nr:UDP-N-acetylglucosamine 2-epimerase (non-hydrolyzing) [Ignavibacteriaceae bacterium]
MSKILFIVGTRPELIKVAPVIQEFKSNSFKDFLIVNTGQHKELLENQWQIFNIKPDFNLDILKKNNSLSGLTINAIKKLDNLILDLKKAKKFPKVIFAQGDTTSVMAASIVSFYHKIKFAHLEAGLRTYDMFNPFPEEMNRRVASIISNYNFVPTELAKENLIREGVNPKSIYLVGNTVVDALKFITKTKIFNSLVFSDKRIESLMNSKKRIVLVTFHRRENHNNLFELIRAIDYLAKNKDYNFIWPVHKNPNIRKPILASSLKSNKNILLTEPLNYFELIKIMSKSTLIITDSGGIQEEAPSFSVPVIVLRKVTERPEGLNLHFSKLVNCYYEAIIKTVGNLNLSLDKNVKNPYGDGKAAKRIYKILCKDL